MDPEKQWYIHLGRSEGVVFENNSNILHVNSGKRTTKYIV